jgi:hypothetical protein
MSIVAYIRSSGNMLNEPLLSNGRNDRIYRASEQ